MRMVRSRVDLELSIHGAAQLRLRQHAAYRLLDHPGWALGPNGFYAVFPQPTWVSAVTPIDFLLFFLTRQPDALGVDDDHVIAKIQERRVLGLVFTLEQFRGLGGDPTQYLGVGVDQVPAASDVIL